MRKVLVIKTKKKKEIADITDAIESLISKESDFSDGLCHLFILHTTACITTADLDPGTDLDMLDAFEKLIPKLTFRHPHNPAHTPDHILSSIIGASVVIPINRGKLTLGAWQRVVLVELDGPRDRQLICSLFVLS